MKTLVALSERSHFADALRAILSDEVWRVIHHQHPWEDGLLTVPGAVDVVCVEADLISVAAIDLLGKLRKLQPDAPIFLYFAETRREWEEEAYLAGATYLLSKPIRHRLLAHLLERVAEIPPVPEITRPDAETQPNPNNRLPSVARTLATLRDLSHVLTHGLLADALPKRFLDLLREILGVNRAAIFLRKPVSQVQKARREPESSRLPSSCAVGLSSGLLDHFELSLEGGIGKHLRRHGRILRSDAPEVRLDREIQKEFALLGVRVAIPIMDRDTLIGAAVFDERLTGEPYTSSDLALVFHALEELGLAIRNSWLHDELARNHELLTEILDQLASGCVVVNRDLQVMHSNPAARRFILGEESAGTGRLEFADLPQVLGSRVFESLQTGVPTDSFRYSPRDQTEIFYQVSVMPFHQDAGAKPLATLLLIDDFTQFQRSQQLEIEASNLRMVRSMAEHLSHEIGNALVPMSTHQQLLPENYDDADFRGSLAVALTQGIKRISRLSNQLLFLTRDESPRMEPVPALQLLEDAFRDAQTLFGLEGHRLEVENSAGSVVLKGNRASLLHALSETLLNALQSSPPDSAISVKMDTRIEDSETWVNVLIGDKGPGFTPEIAAKAVNPFFSTRTVGPGLGLTVARKIIENHHGHLNLVTGQSKGRVTIELPLQNGSSQVFDERKKTPIPIHPVEIEN